MTYKISFVALFCISVLLQPAVHGHLTMPIVNVPSPRVCPEVDELLQQIRSNITDVLSKRDIVSECGDGLWYRVAYLNMTDPSQQCPSAWREYNTSGVRACGRPLNDSRSCSAVFYPTRHQYSKVCGRVVGYQLGSPDAFYRSKNVSIDYFAGYMDGVSITHGLPRNHIWSYSGGVTESKNRDTIFSICPCSTGTLQGTRAQSFVSENYYCESGNSDAAWHPDVFYQSDPLWDGQQCEGTCCSGTKSPPWFSVQLPTHTTDRIEVRICGDEPTENEDTPVEFLEIYVQ